MIISEAIGELSLNMGKTAAQRRAVFVKSLMRGVGERTTLVVCMLSCRTAEGLWAISTVWPRKADLLVVDLSVFSRGCPPPGVKILVCKPVTAENSLLRR